MSVSPEFLSFPLGGPIGPGPAWATLDIVIRPPFGLAKASKPGGNLVVEGQWLVIGMNSVKKEVECRF